jgi:hypothetical protein
MRKVADELGISPATFTPETLASFKFRMSVDRILNHRDATANIPHRYDRPILTSPASETANLLVKF